ncbi:MAG: terminase TerL endonuclease subunit, partial [bacterium]
NYDNINVFMTGLGKVKHPRIGYFTTNGEEREGPLDDMIAAAEGILHEGFPDNGLLAFVCRLDALKEVHDPRNWEKANPSLPYFPSLKWEYEREYKTWKANPQRLPAFIQKRMNLESSSSDTAVTDYKNIKATNREIPDLTGWSCVVGIDFSKITDWASVDFHFRQGDVRYDISHSWLCLQSKDIQRMKCPWKQWADDGRLTLVDDVEIKPEILTEYITEMRMKYLIRAIAIDDFRYALMARALKEIGFDAKVNKNLKLVRPSDIMRAATVIDSCFANQYLVWGDAPELRWATNNAKLVRHGRKAGSLDDADLGNLVYGKIEGKSRKTDPFMAFVASMTIEDRLPNIRTGERRRLSVVTY